MTIHDLISRKCPGLHDGIPSKILKYLLMWLQPIFRIIFINHLLIVPSPSELKVAKVSHFSQIWRKQ